MEIAADSSALALVMPAALACTSDAAARQASSTPRSTLPRRPPVDSKLRRRVLDGGRVCARPVVIEGERIRDVVRTGGFSRFRRVAETPFNLVFEARR